MKIIKIEKNNVQDWSALISLQAVNGKSFSSTYILGAEFLDEKAGALVWEEKDGVAKVLSIYVEPALRGCRIGTELIHEMKKELSGRGVLQVEFEYSEEGDKEILTPFFESFGGQVIAKSYPLGLVTVKEAREALFQSGIDPEDQCLFKDISNQDMNVLYEFVSENTGLDPEPYFKETPGYAIVKNGRVYGLLLMRDSDEDDTVYIDYLWAENNPKALMKILASALKYAGDIHNEDRVIKAVLATKESEKLFKEFFEEPEDEIYLCKGFIDMTVSE